MAPSVFSKKLPEKYASLVGSMEENPFPSPQSLSLISCIAPRFLLFLFFFVFLFCIFCFP